MFRRLWPLVAGLTAWTGSANAQAFVQGSDDCATPLAIAGTGWWTVDLMGATTSGFTGGNPAWCTPTLLNTAPQLDRFFVWTAPADAHYWFSFEGTNAQYAADKEIGFVNLYDGTDCNAACLPWEGATYPNAPGIGRSLMGMSAGDAVLVQVGLNEPFSFWGDGRLRIHEVLSNDDCSTPTPITGLGSFAWGGGPVSSSFWHGAAGACTPSIRFVDGFRIGGHSDEFFTWTAPCNGDFQVEGTGAAASSTDINVYAGSDCSATCLASGAGFGPATVSLPGLQAGDTLLFQLATQQPFGTPPTTFTITQTSSCPPGTLLLLCDPAEPHTLGGPVTLAPSTFGTATPSGLHLEATGGPPLEFGFFLVSSSATSRISVFDGVLCLDEPVGRYNGQVAGFQGPQLDSIGQFDNSGVLQNMAGTAPSTAGSGFDVPLELPFTPMGQSILPGETWAFQLWYRAPSEVPPPAPSSANFSNVLLVSF